MLPANARPWFVEGRIIGLYLLTKTFPDGAQRWRYKRLPELTLEDFIL